MVRLHKANLAVHRKTEYGQPITALLMPMREEKAGRKLNEWGKKAEVKAEVSK